MNNKKIEALFIKIDPRQNTGDDDKDNDKRITTTFRDFLRFAHEVYELICLHNKIVKTKGQIGESDILIRMKGYVTNIEQDSIANNNFRKVVYTADYSQLVLMSLLPNEDIGEETHGIDQFIRVEAGTGKAILDGVEHIITDGFAIVIPAGTKHNIVNTSLSESMKLYTLYAMPHHADGTIHATKADALADHEEFLGDTTE